VAASAFLVELESASPADFEDLRARLGQALKLLGWAEPRVEVRAAAEPLHAVKPEPFVCHYSVHPEPFDVAQGKLRRA
jgi:hypothetical protein